MGTHYLPLVKIRIPTIYLLWWDNTKLEADLGQPSLNQQMIFTSRLQTHRRVS